MARGERSLRPFPGSAGRGLGEHDLGEALHTSRRTLPEREGGGVREGAPGRAMTGAQAGGLGEAHAGGANGESKREGGQVGRGRVGGTQHLSSEL